MSPTEPRSILQTVIFKKQTSLTNLVAYGQQNVSSYSATSHIRGSHDNRGSFWADYSRTQESKEALTGEVI